MKFFDAIGHFFKSLFGADSDTVQTVLHDVSSVASLAAPIIADVEITLKPSAADPTSVGAKLLTFLGKYDKDEAKVVAVANSLLGLPIADILAKAAQFALATFAPPGTPASLINYAVEFAYQIFLKKHAAPVVAVAVK